MPIRRTSNKSSYDSGFYNPEVYSDVGSRFVGYDADALIYINAVEAADGQALEAGVRSAYNNFVLGCKSDGIWNAIKASCIMAGARTLSGALVPLVGVAPSGFNLASGTYSRVNGLKGDGAAMYLDSNRKNESDPQNSKHLSAYLTSAGTSGTFHAYVSAYNTALVSGSELSRSGAIPVNSFYAVNGTAVTPNLGGGSTGFYGTARSVSNSLVFRVAGSSGTLVSASTTPLNISINVFRRPLNTPVGYTDARIAFYSIGEFLDLALLDTRVSGLMVAISGAVA